MARVSEKILSLIRTEAEAIAGPIGMQVRSVKFLREDGMWILRVTASRAADDAGETLPVTIDDCARLHRPLSKRLDELDPIRGSYCLEVTSPGSGDSSESPKSAEQTEAGTTLED